MAQIERLRIYPVKGLDGVDLETSTLTAGGTLTGDREFALFDGEEKRFNAKQSAGFHELSTAFDADSGQLSVETPAGDAATFRLRDSEDRARAADWFSAFFHEQLELRHDSTQGFVDRPDMGPSVISTQTLETVASWFEEMTVNGARRRVRANVEVSGVPAFWEDRFVGEDAAGFEAGGVHFEGVTPCGRCVVPSRDPDTGEPTPEFRTRFIEKRRETFPEWANRDAFDHYFSLMLIARIPEHARDGSLAVGDSVSVTDTPGGRI